MISERTALAFLAAAFLIALGFAAIFPPVTTAGYVNFALGGIGLAFGLYRQIKRRS